MVVQEAIEMALGSVLAKTDPPRGDATELAARIPQTVTRVTWDELGDTVQRARAGFASDHASVVGTIDRLCDLVVESIHRHRGR